MVVKKIVDNNYLISMYDSRKTNLEGIVLLPKIRYEFELKDRDERENWILKNIKENKMEEIFPKNQKFFFKKLKETLNEYSGYSFYNMTGFGDIELISYVLAMKEENKGILLNKHSFEIYSSDQNLKTYLEEKKVNLKFIPEKSW